MKLKISRIGFFEIVNEAKKFCCNAIWTTKEYCTSLSKISHLGALVQVNCVFDRWNTELPNLPLRKWYSGCTYFITRKEVWGKRRKNFPPEEKFVKITKKI